MATIYARKNKDGKVTSYRVQWREGGRDSPIQYESFKKQEQAETWKRLLEINGHDTAKAFRDASRAATSSPTLMVVAEAHLKRLTNISASTMANYRSYLKHHLTEVIGSVPVDRITEEDLSEWVTYMRGKGRSAKTIANVHGLLYSIMDTAVYKGHRVDNPCKHTRLPKDEATEDRTTFLTRSEFALILDNMDRYFHPFFLFLVGTGLRFSEATALLPGDFSDDGKGGYTVRVTKAWKRAGTTGRVVGPPKSKRARRTVPLAPGLAKAVAFQVSCAEPDEPVFCMKQGGEMTSMAVNSRVWKPAIARARAAGLKKSPRIHDLRHTYASWMLNGNPPMSIFELSRFMGHESVNTTTKVYSHLMPEALSRGAQVMGDAMAGLYDLGKGGSRRQLE